MEMEDLLSLNKNQLQNLKRDLMVGNATFASWSNGLPDLSALDISVNDLVQLGITNGTIFNEALAYLNLTLDGLYDLQQW